MTAVVAVTPTPAPTPGLLSAAGRYGDLEHWTPLGAPAWARGLPGPLGRYAGRRHCGDRASAALLAVDAAFRAWAGAHTDRRYTAELALRLAIDAWTAQLVRRRRPSVVVASTLAARHTFAVARELGARCVLVLDLPLLRALHRDLDHAARVWPDRAFLRRYRAPSWAIARQESERVLADHVIVRGAYARQLCVDDGVPEHRIEVLPARATATCSKPAVATGRVRLAGIAAARHGIDTALAVTRALDLTLVVRTGEGTEPADLAAQPMVATDDGPVDAVICPAVCETYAPELDVSTLPVIASPMASRDGGGPDPYDADAFARAIERALA